MIPIKIDSRKVLPGDMFVAIRGNTVDGHDFIDQAIKNGATTVVIDHEMDLPKSVNAIIVKNTEEWLTSYLVNNYSEEINKMDLIGITGTNGKTTTAYLTYQLLNGLEEKTSYIGTIGFYLDNGDKVDLPNTTPNILDLYDLILTAKENGSTTVVMEVSSQGLDMNRTKGLIFKTGLFTNLTQDHLDYHKTMENYLNCKLKLLDQLEGPMIVNADDPASVIWENNHDNCISFGKNGDIKIIKVDYDQMSTHILMEYQGVAYNINTNLVGEFNVYNYLGTLAIALEQGHSLEDIIYETNLIYPPKGRCETIEVNNGIAVVDYAHTPDGMEKVISSFKNTPGRIITVFGCGGDRDKTKRPIMGKVAVDNSDLVIITSDNPRTEDRYAIINDIIDGLLPRNFIIQTDRKKAIEFALSIMKPEDKVLILGKGHEDYQIIGKTKYHFSDVEVVEEYKNREKEDIKKRVKE